MNKEYLDFIYRHREMILSRIAEQNAITDFNGNENSCHYEIHQMQSAETNRELEKIDMLIAKYLELHSS